jgi:hypothetical protein
LITQQCRIGRNPSNDLVINDRAAEDFHAVIMLSQENLIFIEDQNSRYGTLVNGERISKAQLFPGDEVQIGFCRIDWETRTGFLPSLNEIEVIPNLSVPVKRPIKQNSAFSNSDSNEKFNQLNKGDASKELANTLIENEVQMDRIENVTLHDEKIETLPSINEGTISSDNHFNEVSNAIQIEKNNDDHLPIIESIKEDVVIDNESTIELDSSEDLPLKLNQEIDQVESPILTENQPNKLQIESNSSDELKIETPPIYLKNNDPIKEQLSNLVDSQKKHSFHQKSVLIRKDSIQILLAIALTCILLAAGWLIGQAS